MVHPTELLRSESNGERSFAAPLGNYRNDIDCGLKALPCLHKWFNLEKCAKPGIFVLILSILGFLYGSLLSYFRATSHLWSRHYNIDQDTIDWLVYTNEVFVGIFALAVSYWGNRIHRATWLGSLAIYLAIASATLAVPEIYNPYRENETNIDVVTGPILCERTSTQYQRSIIQNEFQIVAFGVIFVYQVLFALANVSFISHGVTYVDDNLSPKHSPGYIGPILCERTSTQYQRSIIQNEFQIVAFGVIFVYQVLFALANVSFISHGVTYVDDNLSPKHSPGYIGLALAANEIGKQAGIYLSWIPFILKTQSIFVSPVWLVIALLLLLSGCIIAMFPKIMPNMLIKKSVTSLLTLASGNAIIENEEIVDGFFRSLWRVLKNRILLINIISLVLMKSALINFTILEKFFNQSQYHVEKYNDSSGYTDATFIQFTSNLLKQPLMAISVVTSGMIIAKMKPSAKCLVIWNIVVFILIGILFASTRFWSCANKFKNELRDQLIIPYCSYSCGCSLDGPFLPVCLNGETYFSPCIAGCADFDSNLKVYQNCTCGISERNMAIQGSCDVENCSTLLALAQANSVISSGLLATVVVSNLIINMRCVSSKDKALALGFELTFFGLIPYVPIKAIYDAIADNFCQIYGKHSCQFYSEHFGFFLATATVTLMVLATIFAIILLFFIKDLQLYTNNQSPHMSYIEPNSGNIMHNNNTISTRRNRETTSEEQRQNLGESVALIHNNNVDNFRRKQVSEGRLNTLPQRSSKEDRMNMYVSEGDLVPPLKSNIKVGKSTSKTSNTSGISTDSSLNAIANSVGDDHDSDTFSGPTALTRPAQDKFETSF